MFPAIAEAHDIELVGYNDLGNRPGFKMGLQRVGGRWYLYLGHLWDRGWSVVDVSDPQSPRHLNFIDGPEGTWTLQVQVADGLMITGLEKPVEGWGIESGLPFEEGAWIWDVSGDPANPALLGKFATGGTGTHRNYYSGGRYAYLAANPEGYFGGMLVIVDLLDPQLPREVSRWWYPGQATSLGESPEFPAYLHGPAYVVGDLAYLSYGGAGLVILDVTDRRAPKMLSRVSFGDLGSTLGCHSAVPLPGTHYLVVNSEALLEGDGDPLNYVFIVDVADPVRPKIVASMPSPIPTSSVPYRNYFEKGGRFGPHNQHHYQSQHELYRSSKLVFMTYFNAGLRIFSVDDPLSPREIAYFVPENPPGRVGPLPSELVVQFEDVLVDSRGYIYCTDKNYGLFVLRYSGNE